MIEFKNVSLKLPRENAFLLEDVSFSLPEGKTLVLIGPSGHGKTVFLKLIAGLIKPTSGDIIVDSVNTSALEGRSLSEVQKKMGMLFQKNALFDSLTCLDNLVFPLRELTGIPQREAEEKSQKMLEAVKLPAVANLFPDELSGGMQKRVGIARALIVSPQIILYDDPTAGLDPITSRHIVDLILEMQNIRKSTVVAVTNDMSRAYQMADTIGLIFNKHLILTGSPEETRTSKHPAVQQFVQGLIQGPITQKASEAEQRL